MVSLDAIGFKNVGIDGSLCKEGDALELARLFVKYLYELAADDFSLLLRVGDTLKQIEEAVGCVNIYEVGVKLVAENFDYLLALALAHETVVDVHAYELFAYRFDKESGDNGGIHTP